MGVSDLGSRMSNCLATLTSLPVCPEYARLISQEKVWSPYAPSRDMLLSPRQPDWSVMQQSEGRHPKLTGWVDGTMHTIINLKCIDTCRHIWISNMPDRSVTMKWVPCHLYTPQLAMGMTVSPAQQISQWVQWKHSDLQTSERIVGCEHVSIPWQPAVKRWMADHGESKSTYHEKNLWSWSCPSMLDQWRRHILHT